MLTSSSVLFFAAHWQDVQNPRPATSWIVTLTKTFGSRCIITRTSIEDDSGRFDYRRRSHFCCTTFCARVPCLLQEWASFKLEFSMGFLCSYFSARHNLPFFHVVSTFGLKTILLCQWCPASFTQRGNFDFASKLSLNWSIRYHLLRILAR